MNIRKLILSAFVIVFSSAMFSTVILASEGHLTPEKVFERSNEDVKEVFQKENYFPARTGDGEYRKDLIQKKIDQYSKGAKNLGYEIVYGRDHGKWLIGDLWQYSGYSKNGTDVSTEGVRWTAGWSGKKIQDFNLIKSPWDEKDFPYKIRKSTFDDYQTNPNKYLEQGNLEQAIQNGLNERFAGKKYIDFIYNNQDASRIDQFIYDRDAKPQKGGKWIDYVHVYQPPTYLSWGYGRVYIQNRSSITYLDIPIAPFSLNQDDISASFESLPVMSPTGEEVGVGVVVKSTFLDPVKVSYSWSLKRKSDGKSLTKSEDGLLFRGSSTTQTGELTLEKGKEYLLYADFMMPESDVAIEFKINEDGKSPEEERLDNNVLRSDPIAVRWVKPEPIGYSVLTWKVKHPLMSGDALTAVLTKPKGEWIGNARGALQVTNKAVGVLRDFVVANNPPVNEAISTIARRPVAKFTIDRKDFGDDPQNGKWLNPENPSKPISKTGRIGFSGSVSRDYEDRYEVCEEDADGKSVCTTHDDRGTATADFPSGTDIQFYQMYVYNGKKTLDKQSFKNTISSNTKSSLTKKLQWESEPYLYDVIRWMYHWDENKKPYDETAVGGQYKRTFTQQASADIKWKIESSMQQEYEQARSAAANRDDRKSSYDKAVFATDRELQLFDYPIKSGYYFNPAGSYTFTVETVSYKKTTTDTKDHKDLVSTLVDSFRYESDLIYINSNREAVNIRNEQLAKRGAGFEPKMGVLTAANNQGVDGHVLLTVLDRSADDSRYTKKVEEIQHSQQPERSTHAFWKRVLEGYKESGTSNSYDKYEYREYVKAGQKMYKITEKTEVTIVINPENIPIYTHANMANDEYHIRVWIDDASLSKGDHEYKKLPTLRGIERLDSIKVTVQGSMYDDLDN